MNLLLYLISALSRRKFSAEIGLSVHIKIDKSEKENVTSANEKQMLTDYLQYLMVNFLSFFNSNYEFSYFLITFHFHCIDCYSLSFDFPPTASVTFDDRKNSSAAQKHRY